MADKIHFVLALRRTHLDKNTSHLAGEFLAAGELSRRGLGVSIAIGNAKSVDIVAQSTTVIYRVDAKAVRAKTNWPLNQSSVDKDLIYVFVYLGTAKAIKKNEPPEYYIVPGSALLNKRLVTTWPKGRSGVTYKTLSQGNYKDDWGIFK